MNLIVGNISMTEPLFRSAHNALLFAFNFSAQQYERPMMNRMADDPIGQVSKGLSGMDGAAQAAMVFNQLEHMPALYQYIVFASYAPRSIECACGRSCCAGHKPNEFWLACIREIEEAAITQALPGCISHRVLRRDIVMREFGDKTILLDDIAEKTGVARKTVTDHAARIRFWLNGSRERKGQEEVVGVRTKAIRTIEEILIEKGLV